LNQQSIYI